MKMKDKKGNWILEVKFKEVFEFLYFKGLRGDCFF